MPRIENRHVRRPTQPTPASRTTDAAAAQPAAEAGRAAPVTSDRLVEATTPATARTTSETVTEAHAQARSRRSSRGAARRARQPVAVNIYPESPAVDDATVRRDAPGHWFARDANGKPVEGPRGDRTLTEENGTKILNLPNTDPRAEHFPEYLFGGDELTEYRMDFPLAKPNADGNFTHLKPGSVEHDQVLTHAYIHDTLDMTERYLGRKLRFDAPNGELTVRPHAGVGFNAFYNRVDKSLNFLMFKNPDGTIGNTSTDSDIVSHEFGHAIHDSLRPKLWNGMETYYDYVNVFGFSEGGSDTISLLQTLGDPDNQKKIIEDTGGDLSRKNLGTELGEVMGKALKGYGWSTEDGIRSFINPVNKDMLDQKLADWLKAGGPDSGDTITPVILGYQMGQTLATTVYDMIKASYDQKVSERVTPDMTPEQKKAVQEKALAEATDTIGRVYGKALDFVPMTGRRFKLEKLGQAMLKADKLLNAGANTEIINKALEDRKLITLLDRLDMQTELPDVGKFKIDFGADPKEAIKKAQAFVNENRDKMGLTSERNSDFRVTVAESDAFDNTIINMEQDLKAFDNFGPCVDPAMYKDMGAVGMVFGPEGNLVNFDKDAILTDREVDIIRGELTAQAEECDKMLGMDPGTEYVSATGTGPASTIAKAKVLDIVRGAMQNELNARGYDLATMPAAMREHFLPSSFKDLDVKLAIQRDKQGKPHVMVQTYFGTEQGTFLVQQRVSDVFAGKKDHEFRLLTGHLKDLRKLGPATDATQPAPQ